MDAAPAHVCEELGTSCMYKSARIHLVLFIQQEPLHIVDTLKFNCNLTMLYKDLNLVHLPKIDKSKNLP